MDLAYTALFTVLLAVCAWITVPLTVPFTLQTFGVFAALGTLGGRRGTYAVAAYLLLGLAGLPVFSGFRGGPGVLLGTTGGYILGFLASALLRPRIIICLGRIAAKAIIREDFKITEQHGQWFERRGVQLTAIYHPSALLRDEGKRPETFVDLKAIQAKVREVCTHTDC